MDFSITDECPAIPSVHGNCINLNLPVLVCDEGVKNTENDSCNLSAHHIPISSKKHCCAVVESSSFTVPSDLKVRNLFNEYMLLSSYLLELKFSICTRLGAQSGSVAN